MNTIIYCIWRGDITFKNDSFNEIDNLLLSQISYISFGDLFAPGDKKTIKELAQLCLDNIDIFRKGSRLFSDSIPALKAMVNTCDGEYNIQAQLLSDNSHYPLRVSIFDGETKASNLFAVREFGFNCLLYSLDELLRYGDVLNIIQADEEKRIVERKEVPLFDNRAFIEAIINAVLHNRWVDGNEPIVIFYLINIVFEQRFSA